MCLDLQVTASHKRRTVQVEKQYHYHQIHRKWYQGGYVPLSRRPSTCQSGSKVRDDVREGPDVTCQKSWPRILQMLIS